MKKNLLQLLLLALMPWYNIISAQCNVTNVVVSNVRSNPYGADSMMYTIDLQFNATVNGGNKDIWLHIWKESDYPATAMQRYNCNGQQSTAPAPSTFTSANNNLDVLDKAFLTFGFDDNAINFDIAGTAGIFTAYHYDPAIIPNYQGATIYRIAHATDPNVDHVYIQNLSFKVSNQTIDFLQVRAFSWSTVGDNRPQCWGCGETFVVGDPNVSGTINCTSPRTYNINIQSKYDDITVPGLQTITGTYRLYIDVDRNEVINEGIDTLVQTSTAFTTGFVPNTVQPGYKSAYVASVLPFNNYVYSVGDTNSTKDLIALVNVTTPGYIGAGTTGILVNPCAPLPVNMISFSAKAQSGTVKLTWETAQEFNFAGFDVERKTGNRSFSSIAFVSAKANEGEQASYQFIDADVPSGEVLLYRLRLVNNDGSFTYSDVRAIRNNAKKVSVSIYPNPTNGNFTIAVPADAGLYDMMLSDYSGRVMRAERSLRNQSFKVNKLLPGVYMLKIWFRETGETITEKVIVQ